MGDCIWIDQTRPWVWRWTASCHPWRDRLHPLDQCSSPPSARSLAPHHTCSDDSDDRALTAETLLPSPLPLPLPLLHSSHLHRMGLQSLETLDSLGCLQRGLHSSRYSMSSVLIHWVQFRLRTHISHILNLINWNSISTLWYWVVIFKFLSSKLSSQIL